MYRLICKNPAHFLYAQMALVGTFFQMFIVLGMYNFDVGFSFFCCLMLFVATQKTQYHHLDKNCIL